MHKPIEKARVGLFACSPLDSSFEAQFTSAVIKNCEWSDYKPPQ